MDEEAIQVISRHNEMNCKYKLDKLYVFGVIHITVLPRAVSRHRGRIIPTVLTSQAMLNTHLTLTTYMDMDT